MVLRLFYIMAKGCRLDIGEYSVEKQGCLEVHC